MCHEKEHNAINVLDWSEEGEEQELISNLEERVREEEKSHEKWTVTMMDANDDRDQSNNQTRSKSDTERGM